MKRIGAILIMSVLMVFLAACAGGGGGNGGTPPTPIGVLNFKVIPDTNNATLTWSNPNVNITQISIIYRNTAAGSVEKQINITAITDSNNIRPSANVTKVIPNLTNGANYTFNVALELGGADEGKSVMATERTLLIGPNFDGDEYADDEDVDDDNDGVNDERDPSPRNASLSAFMVTELSATPGDESVTLSWNNPAAQIASINISYHNTSTPDALQYFPLITDIAKIEMSATNVQQVIDNLANGESYNFTVSLTLNGTDAGKEVAAQSVNATPNAFLISVSNLRVFPDVSSANLTWSNPNVNITQISIIYRNTAAGSVEKQINITEEARIRPNVTVTEVIPNLTNGTTYVFRVALKLGGADEGKSVIAREITRLIGSNLDGDEYADADPNEFDIDGDDVNNTMDAFPNDPTEDTDTDNDGVGNNTDAFPLDSNESMDTDGDRVGDNADAFPRNASLTAFAVSELRATPGDESVTLRWNNPNNRVVQIASIDISYKRTGTDDAPMMISSTQTTSGATNVEQTITGLTNGQSYTFTVSLTLMDPDAGMVGPAPSTSATPDAFAVTGLYGISGANYVTLSWNNPDASIESISISYQVSGPGNLEESSLITDPSKIAANASVQHNISGLMTGGVSYDFTVSLILSGPDAGKEGVPPTIRNILVDDNYDGDAFDNFVDVDADGDGLIEIATAQQLNQSRHNLGGSNFTRSAGGMGDANGCGNGGSVTECNGYELIADIYLTTYANWQPIGGCPTYASFECTDTAALFNTIFDGNNHTINDLTITNPADSYANAAGLFGAISSTSILRNIHIRSGNISGGGRNVGLLVGYAVGANISNSSAEGAVNASGGSVGGLVGDGQGAIITSSYAAGGAVTSSADIVGGLVGFGEFSIITSSYAAGGAVSGTTEVGGLVGFGRDAEITSSYAAGGDVSGTAGSVGGLVGYGRDAEITSSYAAGGDVSGTAGSVGGLVGDGLRVTITSSYAAGGSVSGDDRVGGLVGNGGGATITSSYAAGGDVSGTGDDVGGLVGFGDAEITSSYAAGGDVSGDGDEVGGLVGNGFGSTINSSYAAGGAVSGANNVGGLVGGGGSATITSSYAAGGSVNGTGDNVGGLVGDGSVTTITSSYAAGGAVSGTSKVGGLVGEGGSVMITSSYVAGGAVSGTGNKVGGLVGEGGFATITSSYAAGGAVSGLGEVGGLVGGGGSATITSSYAAGGTVSGNSDFGGLVGGGTPMTVTASYWDSEKSGITEGSVVGESEGKTTDELKMGADDIYSTWAAGTCADGTTLTWNFGTTSDYPALNCTPNGFLPQRRQR